jgi:LPXTG-motif cell wall-anchored protein
VNHVDAGTGGQADPGDDSSVVLAVGGLGVVVLGTAGVLSLRRRGAQD